MLSFTRERERRALKGVVDIRNPTWEHVLELGRVINEAIMTLDDALEHGTGVQAPI